MGLKWTPCCASLCAAALLRLCQERANHHPFWCCCNPSLLTRQPWNVLSQCKHTDSQQTLKITKFCTDIDGQDAEKPMWKPGVGRGGNWKLGQNMGIQEVVSGERIQFDTAFLQTTEPKGLFHDVTGPKPHGYNVKGKKLTGTDPG